MRDPSFRDFSRTGEAGTAPGPAAKRHPRRRRRLLWAAAGLAVAVAATVVVVTRPPSPTPAPREAAVTTAPVVRTDLADHEEIDGTLGYSGSYLVSADGGTLTWLPPTGRTVRRGQRVYGVNGHSVPLFYGATPLWRPLRQGVRDGQDVAVLEGNLVALGHGQDVTVDRHFGYTTSRAVRRWQRHLGVEQTGVVNPGDAVVAPEALRVAAVPGVSGGTAGGVVVRATGTRQVVNVDLPVNRRQLAVRNAKVSVDLPDGRTVPGRVRRVSAVATAPSGSAQDRQPGQATGEATVPVEVVLTGRKATGGLDGAPVTVSFTSRVDRNVLAVPVAALLARSKDSYAVRVVDASGAGHDVPVRLGSFALGLVEVSGPGITEGARVEVPSS
ncbi:peptidoglycan-binding protein [Streptosporangium sp. NPDC000239]|uniref:peptidoglycan-binding protein n=1 Tax=Streptosporangium sp. NPDC000239 TaxID=3154248 RepID=UPI003332CBA1